MAEYFTNRASNNEAMPIYPTLAEYGKNIEGSYTTLAVFHNRFSTNARGTQAVIEQLRAAEDQHGMVIEVYETAPTAAENKIILDEIVTPNTVVAPRTGDGPLGQVLAATEAPVLVIPGGNKNDLAHQILSPQAYANPLYTLAHGTVRPIRPAFAHFQSLDDPTNTQLLEGFGYITAGDSSLTTAAINWGPYRAMLKQIRDIPGAKFVAERAVALHALVRSPAFSVQHTEDRTRRTIEFMIANGSVIAGTLYPDVDLFTPEARIIRVRNRALGTIAITALATGIPFGRHITGDEQAVYHVEIPKKPTMYVQVEGEEYMIAPGEYTLTVGISERAAHVLTA